MYLLDTNIFIEAKNRYFGFDICPGFWQWLRERHVAGTIFSVDAVRSELLRGNDQLADWTRTLPRSFFLSPDADTAPHLATLSQWANDPARQFYPNAISGFLGSADYLLTAQARQHNYTVVTQERFDPDARRRIVIPVACRYLEVDVIAPFELMRREGLRLILDRNPPLTQQAP